MCCSSGENKSEREGLVSFMVNKEEGLGGLGEEASGGTEKVERVSFGGLFKDVDVEEEDNNGDEGGIVLALLAVLATTEKEAVGEEVEEDVEVGAGMVKGKVNDRGG